MLPLWFFALGILVFLEIKGTSATPMLPKTTIRYESQLRPAITAARAQYHSIPGGRDRGEPEGHGVPISLRPLTAVRLCPFGLSNTTAAAGSITATTVFPSPTSILSVLTDTRSEDFYFDTQTQATSSSPGVVTDTFDSSPTSTLPATGVRTFPPTTAISTQQPPLPQSLSNLTTQSWLPPPPPMESPNADCPFESDTQPDTESTTTLSFPVIVTVLPVPTPTATRP